MSEYNCDSCGVPDELCNRHNECVAEVWHTALKLAVGQKPPTNSQSDAITLWREMLWRHDRGFKVKCWIDGNRDRINAVVA